MLTPASLRDRPWFSRSAPAASGSGSATTGSARPPSVGRGPAGAGVAPRDPRPAAGCGAHTSGRARPDPPAAPRTLCPHRGAGAGWAGAAGGDRRSGPAWGPGAARHAGGRRSRRGTAGFHSRRRGGCVSSPFFPRSVGFGPTASRARGALTIAPSILCQAQAIPSSSSYSASPFRQSLTKTFRRFHSRKYLWTALALPNCGLGQGLPLDAGAQDEDDRLEDLPGLHRLAPAPGAAEVPPALLPLPLGDEGFDLGPQLIRDCPRFDGAHGISVP